jgi:hypothetical protein
MGELALPARWSPVRLLGEGGQAEVWLAEDLELGQPVAVKVFSPELSAASRERLRREVRLGRSLQHPGLVRIYELIEAGPRLAIVMEWVPGGSLSERLGAGAMPVANVIEVARQVLEVLAYLHEKEVVHRDIKPSNVLLDANGKVKLADLGLARSLSAAGVTVTAAMVGTPAYMSPEQLLGRPSLPASDLYSLGVTLYELLTGAPPFAGEVRDGPDHRLVRMPPSPRRQRPECPRWLARFVLRLLEREPRDRFRTAGRALQAFDRQRGLLSPRLGRQAAVAGAVLLLLGALGGSVVWRLWRRTLTTVTVSEGRVTVHDRGGAEMWHRDFGGGRPAPLIVDVVGDATPEVVVALKAGDPGLVESEPDLFVIGADGTEITRVASALGSFSDLYPMFTPRTGGPVVTPMDLDGDGRMDLLWRTTHAPWYPCVLGAWNLRAGFVPSSLMVNSGTIHSVTPADLDGDGRPELILTGINNPLGYQLFLAIVRLEAGTDGRSLSGATSPDLFGAWMAHRREPRPSLIAYNLLGPYGVTARLDRADRDGLTLQVGEARLVFDAAGNATSSLNAGQGPLPRLRLWDALVAACMRLEGQATSWQVELASLQREHAPVLSETPVHDAVALMMARSLARTGRNGDAAALLEDAVRSDPEGLDLWLRLGEQLAVTGQVRAAEDAFARAVPGKAVGRPPLDASIALCLLTSWNGDDAEYSRAVKSMSVWSASGDHVRLERELGTLRAFGLGQWKDVSLDPPAVATVVPPARVLRLWAMLERGAAPDEVRQSAVALLDDPEVGALASLLVAAIDTRSGAAAAAVGRAEQAHADLERRGREAWEVYAWVPLAECVLADALAASGRGSLAPPHRARALALAPATWFGSGAAHWQRSGMARQVGSPVPDTSTALRR